MVMYESDKCTGLSNGKLLEVKWLFKVDQYQYIGYRITILHIVCNLKSLYVLLSAIFHKYNFLLTEELKHTFHVPLWLVIRHLVDNNGV
jgi:hypothetical protein